MSAPTIWHNPRCSKSRETLALIEGKGIAPVVVEYLKTPPGPAELARVLALLGKGARDIVRRKEAAEAGIDVAALSEPELIEALCAHPAAIERPIVITADKAAVGRPPESVLEILLPESASS
jgi:arsenate reductase